LDLGYGDYEEHAILLANYFNYIDIQLGQPEIKSYIILGKAVPEGYTTYVLRRNTKNNHVEIWNAIKGEAVFYDKK
jgi:coiled-coil and C2 domain-containing protein 2A